MIFAAVLAIVMALVGVDILRNKDEKKRPEPAYAATVDSERDKPEPQTEGETRPRSAPSAPQPSASSAPRLVQRGGGTFTRAPGGTAVVGRGRVNTYQIMVEDGIEQDPTEFARAVDATLGDPRSWTAGGDMAFQRIETGAPQFFIYLASPDTVDNLCAPLDTNGYTSCRVGNRVVINLARWLLAVPEFSGDVATYRLYVINHEVGHRLGHGHERCPGAGQLAPVMQQQTLGLDGCRPNPWPFVDGRRYAGRPTA